MTRKNRAGTTRLGLFASVAAFVVLGHGVASAQTCGAGSTPLPAATLTQGEYYFRINNVPTLLLGINPYGPWRSEFTSLFALASANEKVVRVHVHSIAPHPTSAGQIDQAWVDEWHNVFCDAEANGLYVLPVLDVWANWNHIAKSTVWDASAYNTANGGPATTPWDLVPPGPTQDAWLGWLRGIVDQWKTHSNIIGWEIFSEIDNIIGPTGFAQFESNPAPVTCTITPTNAPSYDLPDPLPPLVCLVENAAAKIREVDAGRPVTASLKGVNDWVSLGDSSLDFLQVHPYANVTPIDGGNLDTAIIDHVRLRRTAYGKPVFIGESGLDELFQGVVNGDLNALTLNERGWIGINQAIWAGAVAGSMNARNLWYEDGYDVGIASRIDLCTLELPHFEDEPACLDSGILTLHEYYQNASAPVKNFLTNDDLTTVDYSDFAPVTLTTGGNLLGATLGNTTLVIGWVRDVLSAHDASASNPYWPWRLLGTEPSLEMVTVQLPGQSADWRVDFYDTTTGDVMAGSSIDVDQDLTGAVTFALPSFEGSIAFKIFPVEPITVELNITPRFPRHNNMNLQFRHGFGVVIVNTFVAGDPPAGFDATTVNPSSVRVGPLGAIPARSEMLDFQQDGDVDLVMGFRMDDPGFPCGDSDLVLTGETNTGRSIIGSGPIRVIGCGP